MAIKIVDETPNARVVERVVCDNCGVTLEYTPADTRKYDRKDYTGGSSTHTVLDCPKCSHEITLSCI